MNTDFKTLILPGQYEDAMKGLSTIKDKKNIIKAVNTTVDVLKSYGYDSGADIFVEMIKSALE